MAKTKKYRIVLAGGGTGGHIYPLLAVAEELKKIFEKNGYLLDLHFVVTPGRFEDEIKAAGIKVHKILAGKFRRYLSFGNLIDIPKIFIGLIQAFLKIYAIMPNMVFSKGGPGAFQTVLAARFHMIPVIIHESDAYPGLTNLLSAKFAKRIAISFEAVTKYFNPSKTILTGNPLRPSLLRQQLESGAAKEALGFSSADDILRIFPSHPAEYSPRRVRRGIHSKLIYTSSRGKILKKQDDELLREARYIPADKFPFTCDVAVYGNRVAISALRKNPIGVIIESEEIADSLKTIFNLAWEATEKYN